MFARSQFAARPFAAGAASSGSSVINGLPAVAAFLGATAAYASSTWCCSIFGSGCGICCWARSERHAGRCGCHRTAGRLRHINQRLRSVDHGFGAGRHIHRRAHHFRFARRGGVCGAVWHVRADVSRLAGGGGVCRAVGNVRLVGCRSHHPHHLPAPGQPRERAQAG